MDQRKDPINMPRNKKFRLAGLSLCLHCGGIAEAGYGSDGSTLAIRCKKCGCRTRSIGMPEYKDGTWKSVWEEMREIAAKLWNRKQVNE